MSIHNNLFDKRGIVYDPFNLPENLPMWNPCSFKLINKWEDGFYLFDDLIHGMERQKLLHVKDNVVIEKYNLVPIVESPEEM